MKESAGSWEHLTPSSQLKAGPGARRQKVIGLSAAVAVHLLIVAGLSVSFATLHQPIPVSELAGVTISLVPSSAISDAPSTSAVQVEAKSAQPKPDDSTQPPKVETEATPTPPEPAQTMAVDLTAEPAEVTPPPASPAPAIAQAQSAAAASGATCDLTGVIQQALQTNPQVTDQLGRIPRQAKSVANALMLWDGGWTQGYAPANLAAADPLRQAIAETIRGTSPACQSQIVEGPRLFAIVDSNGTTVIAVGSGAWRWADLLDAPVAGP